MKIPRRRFLHLAAGAAAVPAVARISWAQAYPSRPITMVVPFAAGGGSDVAGRILASRLSELLGRPVIVENVVGAGGMTGSARVAKAVPDGYQFVLGGTGTHATNQTFYKTPLYNAATDFAPVALIAEEPMLLLTRNDLPANNLQEFIAYAKANQARMQFGSAGTGTSVHLGCVLLNAAIGVNVTHVPYRGAGPAMQDLIAGRIDYQCAASSAATSMVEGSLVKPIAILSRSRTATLPRLASAHEQGLADFDVNYWAALFLPQGTPTAIVQKLNSAVVATLATTSVRDRLRQLGSIVVDPERQSPEYLQKFVEGEIEKWAGPIKAAGVSAE
jgi:tripartite-type tricarboxylate transporter receptor subunit TctC